MNHNGWTTYETWRVVARVDNTEWEYLHAVKLAKESDSIASLESKLRGWLGKPRGVNFRELAEHWYESVSA